MRVAGYSGMHKSLKAHQQSAMLSRPLAEQQQQHDMLEWLINEDMALLTAVAEYLELPLSLVTRYMPHTIISKCKISTV